MIDFNLNCKHIPTYTHTHTLTHIDTYKHTHTHIDTYKHTHRHTDRLTHIHRDTHTHTTGCACEVLP